MTDGPNRLVKVGHQTIQLRHTTPRNIATAGRISGLVTQALRHLGQGRVNDTMVALLQQRLTEADKAQLQQDIAFAPAWMWPILRRLSPTLPSAV